MSIDDGVMRLLKMILKATGKKGVPQGGVVSPNYFAVGDSNECFSFVRDWLEKKVRGHLMRARERSGFGWKRWSRHGLYGKLGLYNDYRLRRPWSLPKVQPAASVT